VYGGHQERGARGGTENVALIAGLGRAAELVRSHLPEFDKPVRALRDSLETEILSSISETALNGDKERRLANTTNITFHGVEAEALLLLLDQAGICASSGSACLADSSEPSHVIRAMKPESAASRQSIRFSLGSTNTEAEIESVAAVLKRSTGALPDVHRR
jgi:cysteine desulfurase